LTKSKKPDKSYEHFLENVMRVSDLSESAGPAHDMMLKLRKGAAASLNATKLAQVFEALNTGWKVEKAQFYKQSEGGWVIKEVLAGAAQAYHARWSRNTDGRIHLETNAPRDLDQYNAWGDPTGVKQRAAREEDARKFEGLKKVAAELEKLQSAPEKGKWFVRNVTAETKPARYGKGQMLDVSFEFFVRTGGFIVTSPDGQTYEVFGDYKNGAIDAQTFESWFRWAVENTSIMDEILEALQMEAHEKKHDPKTRYSPPKGSSEELKRVYDSLVEMTNGVREEQKQELITRWKRSLMNFDEAVKAGDKNRVRALAESYDGYIISTCYDVREKKLSDDWESEVERKADKQVEEMQNMFVYKNTHKLTPIIEGKGGREEIEVLGISGSSGVITARLRIAFPDGSNFRADQTVVGSWSSRGTPFYRFPTTFHDVVLPGGTKMGMPSEERMNELFTKARGGDDSE
jgi:hypothetical protein